jgi:hypothetical protein
VAELDPGIGGSEVPLDLALVGVASLPDSGYRTQ